MIKVVGLELREGYKLLSIQLTDNTPKQDGSVTTHQNLVHMAEHFLLI